MPVPGSYLAHIRAWISEVQQKQGQGLPCFLGPGLALLEWSGLGQLAKELEGRHAEGIVCLRQRDTECRMSVREEQPLGGIPYPGLMKGRFAKGTLYSGPQQKKS